MSSWTGFKHSRRVALIGLGLVALVSSPVDAAPAADVAPADVAPVEATAPAPSLSVVLERLAAMRGLSASFREEKHMSLLAVPIVNEGVIYFAPPDKLVRRVDKPMPSTVLITSGRLEVADGSGRQTIDLTASPAVRLFVDSFVKIYAGDQAAPERMYTLALAGAGERWTLTLRPKVAPMRDVIDRIVLDGEGLVVSSMRIEEKNGDVTVTTFRDVRPDRVFTEAEQAALFRVP